MNELLNWYEASLPAPERKRRGHFSTPPLLVACILDACGYSPEQDLSRLRVLDPACGSGNFLAGAARRLIASGRRAGLSSSALTAAVERDIWGFDPDPVACFLAEMQLRAALQDCQCEDACAPVSRLHVHQGDGLALAWGQCANVDLFLANPPYLAAKNCDLSGYHSARSSGQMDSYLLFLRLALQVVRPGGWLGLILPDPVLARANAAKERRQLLEETTVHHLWHLAGVFPASVGAVVIIAQKQPAAHAHRISWLRERWQSVVAQNAGVMGREVAPISLLPEAKSVALAQLRHQPGAELRYLLSEIEHTLVAQLHAHLCSPCAPGEESRFTTLGALTWIWRGEELGKGSPLLSETRPTTQHEWYPVVRGGVDVRPYAPPVAHGWIARTAITKPLERYLAPKLLVVKSSGRLQAALDLRGHVALQTLYLLNPRSQEKDDLYFLLALLNSCLLREYVRVLYTAYKLVQPQIEQHVLASLPVPLAATSEKVRIVELAKMLERACGQIPPGVELKQQELYAALERAICHLYATALRNSVDKGVKVYG